ncbi:hypothetical protein B566_EDAN001822 [Ephemera danica]|nr:hypothetical protein B566_EDAN001822 [Ephemera danica]
MLRKYFITFHKNARYVFNNANKIDRRATYRACHTSNSEKNPQIKDHHETSNSKTNPQIKDPQETKPKSPTVAQQVVQQKKAIATKVQRYGMFQYIQAIHGFEKTLETKFPSAIHVYRVFSVGIRDFYKDIKHFIRVARIASSQDFKELTRKEIELYHQMPRDMLKVAPVLLISALPFANYVVFPIAYMFPRQFLSYHFWSLQQRSDFAELTLKRRLYNQRPVLRCLQSRLEDIESPEIFHKWRDILGVLGSGVHPSTTEVIELKSLFAEEPYHLRSLYTNHVNGLLRLYGMHIGWRRRRRLRDRAFILHEMDLAIEREGILSMSLDELKGACFLRGLNPTTMKTEDMVSWLTRWVTVSKAVDEDSFSLLLHCPILLAYNEPSNWVLIY